MTLRLFLKLVNDFVLGFVQRRGLILGTTLVVIGLPACVSSQAPPRPLDYPYTRYFPAPYDVVWEATLNVLDLYVIEKGDRESGLIETEPLQARFNPELFEFPKQDPRMEDVRYTLKVQLSKGLIAQTGEVATRVQIVKRLSEFKNFFSDWQRTATDHVEEEVILYRIGKRVAIWQALKRKRVGSGVGAGSAASSGDTPTEASKESPAGSRPAPRVKR